MITNIHRAELKAGEAQFLCVRTLECFLLIFPVAMYFHATRSIIDIVFQRTVPQAHDVICHWLITEALI